MGLTLKGKESRGYLNPSGEEQSRKNKAMGLTCFEAEMTNLDALKTNWFDAESGGLMLRSELKARRRRVESGILTMTGTKT